MIKKILKILPFLHDYRYFAKNVILLLKNKGFSVGHHAILNDVKISKYNYVGSNSNLLRVSLGDYSYVSNNCFLRDVSVGKFCSIGPNVQIGLGTHPLHLVSTSPVFFSNDTSLGVSFVEENKFVDHESVHMGNDIWIGANVIIMDGVKIGDGCVLAAGTIVNRDVEDYEVVAGVPCKHIKYRFNQDTISQLKASKWWDMSKTELLKNKDYFLNVEKFIKNGTKKV